ncbi:MAG: hypothetical protein ACXQS3_02360, partial [Candidatus Methanofastidiosia archaeon]
GEVFVDVGVSSPLEITVISKVSVCPGYNVIDDIDIFSCTSFSDALTVAIEPRINSKKMEALILFITQ